ncbi:MAG: acetyl-CoA decarbonylase/synthase complex subunit gamma, partial [Chitinivibrionales bacterium]|nr:acetyl-CoA decarbonylase/synthase complex subunit gamma [Chitinivibrionales bacterium]
MALTGLQIQKLLPKTNCKECGSNTCMAFAMKLAAKKAEISQCPYASDEAKQKLGAATEPPVRTVALGPDKSLSVGGETVLYRHEKTFVNQTLLAVDIDDSADDATIDAAVERVAGYTLERVGEQLRVEMMAVTQHQPDPDRFAAVARRVQERSGRPLVLRSDNADALCLAAEAVAGTGGVLSAARLATAERLCDVAQRYGHALAVSGESLDEITATTALLREKGMRDLLLQLQTHSLSEYFQTNSIVRRAALKDNVKTLGYPCLRFVQSDDYLDTVVETITEIDKYGGICVLPSFDPAQLSALMTLRQNIFTDPQKPIQVEPKVYPIGEPGKDSPVFVTTNFSLTYFLVSAEIENSGTSAWLVVPECEGMSVLT